MNSNIGILKKDLKKYCSAISSIEESTRYLKFAISEFKTLPSGGIVVDRLTDEYYKFICFLHMAIMCYVRPFKNNKFALGEKNVLRNASRETHKLLVNYRNYIIAHHENLAEKQFLKDPENYFQSTFVVDVHNENEVSLAYSMIVPRCLEELNNYLEHVQLVESNLQVEAQSFIDQSQLFRDCLGQQGIFSISNDKNKILERNGENRFSSNEDGSLTVVPKYLR